MAGRVWCGVLAFPFEKKHSRQTPHDTTSTSSVKEPVAVRTCTYDSTRATRDRFFDGTVRFIFVNAHNINKYPVIDMLFNGNKIGIFAAARHLISIKGKKLCPDTACAAVDGAHKLDCKAQQIGK